MIQNPSCNFALTLNAIMPHTPTTVVRTGMPYCGWKTRKYTLYELNYKEGVCERKRV